MCVLLVFKKEWKKTLRHKLKLILMVLLPIITICLTLLCHSQMKPSLRLGLAISSEATTENASTIKEHLNLINGVTCSFTSPATLHTDLLTGKYSAIITVDHPLATNLVANNELTYSDYEISSMDLELKEALTDSLKLYQQTGNLSSLENYLLSVAQTQLSPQARSISFMFLIMLITLILFGSSLHEEATDALLIRYGMAPHSTNTYLLGFFLFMLSTAIIQILVITLILILLHIPLGLSPVAFLALGLILSLICSTIASLIISVTSSELAASSLSSCLGLLLLLLGGALIPFDKMPLLFQQISHFTLIKWLIELTDSLAVSNSISLLVTPLALTLIVSSLILIVSLKLNHPKFFIKTPKHTYDKSQYNYPA